MRSLLGALAGLLLVPATGLADTPASEHAALAPTEVMVSTSPLSLTWYIGSHPGFSDDKVDQGSTVSSTIGAGVSFNRGRWELRPQVEYVNPNEDTAPWSVRAGTALTLWSKRESATAVGLGLRLEVTRFSLRELSAWATGGSLVAAFRTRLSANLALRFELAGGVDLDAGSRDTQYSQDALHFARLTVGLSRAL
jgi:hypothetical protein